MIKDYSTSKWLWKFSMHKSQKSNYYLFGVRSQIPYYLLQSYNKTIYNKNSPMEPAKLNGVVDIVLKVLYVQI